MIKASQYEKQCSDITGLPGHPVEGVTFSNVHITFPGGGTAEEAARRDVPEMKDHYPEYHMFGTLPAYGLYARHASGLTLHNVCFELESKDLRPAIVCDNVEGLELSGFRADGDPEAESLIRLQGTREAFIYGCRPLNEVGAFLRVEGEESQDVVLTANHLRKAQTAVETADGAPEGAVSIV